MPSRLNRRPASVSRPSGDIVGRPVAIGAEVPAVFDVPLAPHHKLIGRWVAARSAADQLFTRQEARRHIEQVFETATLDILRPFDLADLQVVALLGDDNLPPALTILCHSVGQIDLGWIEKSNVLSNTLVGPVAPVGWRAAAYALLESTLGDVLPVFGYADLFEEVSAYYWDGATDDERARATLIEYHGEDPDVAYEMTLPSEMNARRPDWMTAKAAPLKDMPKALRDAIRKVRETHEAFKAAGRDGNAWWVEREHLASYIPGLEDSSHLPPLTIVPFDQFARELDDVGRFGMELGFDNAAGLCPLTDISAIDAWFTTLKLGADFLLAAQQLISLDPMHRESAR